MAYAINFLCEVGWERRQQSEARDFEMFGKDQHQRSLKDLKRLWGQGRPSAHRLERSPPRRQPPAR